MLIDADNSQPSIIEGLLDEIAQYGVAIEAMAELGREELVALVGLVLDEHGSYNFV